MDQKVIVWNPSDHGPKVWESWSGDMAEACALAYLSGVCSSGEMVAAAFDTGRSIVVIDRSRLMDAA